jgi:hypothetical protein
LPAPAPKRESGDWLLLLLLLLVALALVVVAKQRGRLWCACVWLSRANGERVGRAPIVARGA